MKTRYSAIQFFVAGALVAVFLVLAYLANGTPYFAIDLFLSQRLQGWQSPEFQAFLSVVSFFGDTPVAVVSVLLAFLILYFWQKKTGAALLVLTCSCSLALLSKTTKYLVARPRPDINLVQQWQHFTKADSFPSGHVLFAVGFYGMLIFMMHRHMPKSLLRSLLVFVCGAIIALMGIARMSLGAHWFSDVLGAYCLGFFWVGLMVNIYVSRLRK